MSEVEITAREAGVRLHVVGRQALLEAGDALLFLEACAASGRWVLGAEGFDVDGSSVRPDMETILDLSGVADARAAVADAERFVRAVARPGLLLDFTLAEPTPQ
jgi:hypothetical protein